MTRRMKSFLINAALTLFVFALGFGVGETAVRLLYKDQTVLFPRYHTGYQYGRYTIRGVRPNSDYWMTSVDGSWRFVTNSQGFRNTKDFAHSKPPNTFRVLSLGDSHTQGYEVRQESTYSAVLERYLRHHGKNAEVMNAGVSGFSTAEALAFLENEGVKYRPDAVVLGFFANDLEDNDKAGLFGLEEGRLVERKFDHLPGVGVQDLIYSLPGVHWLSENSYFYSMLFNGVWEYFKGQLAGRGERRIASGAAPTPPAPITEYAVPTTSTFSTHQIELTWALVERMHRFCSDRGIRFIVVDVPVETRNPYKSGSSVPPVLQERLAAADVEVVTSESLFQNFDGIAETHVPHGHRHISELTHMMIGIGIARRLKAIGGDHAHD